MTATVSGRAVVLVWILWLGIDFFAHAGLFAGIYEQESPFLLPPEQLFARIPLGYTAFLIYAGITVWTVRRVGASGPLEGARVGLVLGTLITAASSLAIVSVSTIGLTLLAIWTVVQIVEFGVAGYAATAIGRARRATAWTVGVALALVLGGLLLQNLP